MLVKVFFGAISIFQLNWSWTLTVTFVLAGKLWEPVHFFKPGSNVLLELRLLSHGHNVNRWCMWFKNLNVTKLLDLVGYGDIVCKTKMGRVLQLLSLLVGLVRSLVHGGGLIWLFSS